MDLVTPDSLDSISSFLTTKFRKQVYRALQPEIFFVNNEHPETVTALYDTIIERIEKKNMLPVVIPDSWARLYLEIEEHRKSVCKAL